MTPESLAAVMEATWPAASYVRVGPWTICDGQGGGKRVTAATAEGPWLEADIPLAESAMAAVGQQALFAIRAGDDALDHALQARGYRVVDSVIAYTAPCALVAYPPAPAIAAFVHWPPLAICETLWAEGGIGPTRLAVMHRAAGPKCAILSRTRDRPTGSAFVAIHGQTAMLHALEVSPSARRQGSAQNIVRAAARWAQENGATTLAVVATRANAPARALYASLHMQAVGQYHYRQR
jgi:GNAT superfamily N-acetyltransferase